MNRSYHLIIYIVLGVLLLAGSKDVRFRKASYLSKTLYLPLISTVNWIESLLDLKHVNDHLNNKLAGQMQEINRLHQKLKQYQKQDLNYPIPEYDHVIADIVGKNGVFGQEIFLLNKGKSSGIECNMPVLGTEGITGKIINAGQNFSLLMPIRHNQFKLGIMLLHNHLQGLLEADASGRIYMNMLRIGSEISLGDTVVTSNLSQIFPPYYPIGRIESIRKTDDRVNISAEIEPFCQVNSLTSVIVILYKREIKYEEEMEIANE